MVEKFSKNDLSNTRSFKGNSGSVIIEKVLIKKDLLYLIEKYAFDIPTDIEVIETRHLIEAINSLKGEGQG